MAQEMQDSGPVNFPAVEEQVLKLWKELDAFQTSYKQSKNRPKFVFYDGPPFATGLPHYGHILAGTLKDIVTRWAHQSGFQVERRFGWDCHGLPVEYEIDKTLGISGPDDVAKMGIRKYNEECRKIVMRYAEEWEHIVTRLGRWIDFSKDYKTMYPWFMETIWWIFKQLYDKGLVYRGYKVMPFSTACSTPLSNFEAGQNYKDVTDPAVVVAFPLKEDPKTSLLAWTTTPWTLPSNVALCCHPEFMYVKVKDIAKKAQYILLEGCESAVFKSAEDYEVLGKMKGKELEGKDYEPLFPYFLYMKERGGFKVVCDTYVTQDAGVGIVHQAPYFGEDDYRVSLKYGIITKDSKPICPLDYSGKFTEEVTDFKGQYVKEADKNIVKKLKEIGRMVVNNSVNHSYPFCWRSDTPLLYRAVPSWFVRVEAIKDKLISSNQKSYWVPDFVKEKRFGNWLKDARDWAISRNRYWGTPIPIWVSEDMEEIVCVGSIEELGELTGRTDISDLHRENIDTLTIPSRCGKGDLHRITEVFDCWFESGSMPYAQNHYPFEKRREFEDSFPGDFISEGIDQTRGWFYTLMVLSTALFGQAPFKNLICHGLVLAADGQKMSKRKKNYPDPMDVVNSYGADAIRLYLINSPVVRADNLRFKEEGVRDVVKDVFLPWYNAYKFLLQNLNRLHKEEGVEFRFEEARLQRPSNYMDRWILSFTQSLVKYVKEEMAAYRLYTVVPPLVKFVDQLTNWYVRMNRKRLKGEGGMEDCQEALRTLFSVLFTMCRVMAPFIPFLTEHMYQNMKKYIDTSASGDQDTQSIHYLMLPEHRDEFIDQHMEKAVSRMQSVVELGRVVRDRNTMPMKYPLKEVVVIHRDTDYRNDIIALQPYIVEELNVRNVTSTGDKEKYGVRLKAQPDFKALGARLKGDLKNAMNIIKDLGDKDLMEFQQSGRMLVAGHTLGPGDVNLCYSTKQEATKKGPSQYEAHSDNDVLVLLDITPDKSMLDEGLAREVINRVQKLRKKGKLVPSDQITVYYQTSENLGQIIQNYSDFIFATIKQPLRPFPVKQGADIIVQEDAKVKADSLKLVLVRGHLKGSEPSKSCKPSSTPATPSSAPSSDGPVCRYVNIELCGIGPCAGATGCKATVLLENPRGDFCLTLRELTHQVKIIFGLQTKHLTLHKTKEKACPLSDSDVSNIFQLHGSWLYAYTH